MLAITIGLLAIAQAAPLASPPPLPTTLPQFVTSPGYQADIARIFAALPAEVFRRCSTLVSEGSQVTMMTPVRFNAAGRPVAGAWRQAFPVRGCGNDTTINLFFTASAAGTVTSGVGAPGTTLADLTLQRDALRYARLAVLPLAKDCAQPLLRNTRYEETDGTVAPPVGSKVIGQPWKELWTLAGCGRTVAVPITFIPDATGTTISAGKATFAPD